MLSVIAVCVKGKKTSLYVPFTGCTCGVMGHDSFAIVTQQGNKQMGNTPEHPKETQSAT